MLLEFACYDTIDLCHFERTLGRARWRDWILATFFDDWIRRQWVTMGLYEAHDWIAVKGGVLDLVDFQGQTCIPFLFVWHL